MLPGLPLPQLDGGDPRLARARALPCALLFLLIVIRIKARLECLPEAKHRSELSNLL